jgi:hypothetical protein
MRGLYVIGFRTVVVVLLTGTLSACSTLPAPDDAPVAPVAVAAQSMAAAPELPRGIRLVGMDSSQVQGLLGQPALQRRERPAQYWRYSYAGCILDLFLYVEMPADVLRVAYFEVRPDGRAGVSGNPRCERIQASLGRMADDAGALPPVEAH